MALVVCIARHKCQIWSLMCCRSVKSDINPNTSANVVRRKAGNLTTGSFVAAERDEKKMNDLRFVLP
jgi:hypothetical protein